MRSAVLWNYLIMAGAGLLWSQQQARSAGALDARNYPDLSHALDALAPGDTLYLPPHYVATVNAGLVVKTSGVTIRCEPGAAIIKRGNFNLITVTASNVTLEDCTLDGAHGGGNQGNVVLMRGASNFRLSGLTIKNSEHHGIYLNHASHGMIDHNTISGMLEGDAIFGENETHDIIVESNSIDRSDAVRWGHSIGFHSTSIGEPISQITIADNNIYNGFGYCVEIGSFGEMPGGSAAQSIVVSNNNCTQAPLVPGEIHWGGYSFAGTDGVTVTGNIYFNLVGSKTYNGIEMVTGVRATVTGNTLWGSRANFNNQSYSIFSSNNIYSLYPATGPDYGFYIGGSNAGINSNYNTIEGNVIIRTGWNGKAAWTPRKYYSPGTIVKDANGKLEMTVAKQGNEACKSGAATPEWNSTHKQFTTDDQCVWQSVTAAPSSPVEYFGIRLQCNGSDGADCSHNQILNNKIVDNGASQKPAITLENDAAATTTSDTIVAGNQIVGWNTCYATNVMLGTTYIYNNDEDCAKIGKLAGHVLHSTLVDTICRTSGCSDAGHQ